MRSRWHSTVSGGRVDTAELTPEYWYRNLRQTVLFEPVVRSLLDAGSRAFIEVSPHPVVGFGVRETIDDALPNPTEATLLPTLRRDESGPERFALSLGQAHCQGVPVEWGKFFAGVSPRRVALPTYPFQRQRHWIEELSRSDPETGDADPAQAGFWEAVERGDLDELAAMLPVETDEGMAVSLEAVVPALAAWRRRGRNLSALDGLCYRERWVPAAVLPASAVPGTWLVVSEPGQRGDFAVSAALEALGDGAVRVELDPGADEGTWAADLRAAASGSAGVEGVLSLLALTSPGRESSPAPDALGTTIALLSALEEAEITAPIWIATRGAVSVDSADPVRDPLQARLWGFGRCFALEEPARWGGLVDFPAELGRPVGECLCGVLGGGGEEDQVALREGGVFARRLVRAPAEPATGRTWVVSPARLPGPQQRR